MEDYKHIDEAIKLTRQVAEHSDLTLTAQVCFFFIYKTNNL